ncbi:hypothetical protein R69776_03477 [Paraburkholderia nemoris]|uniref:Transposase n=1 Tax=Paraburkholderia nemoris TaxID=2793076 RepID=A0ABM8RNR6_9BURK|nr:hypothetical protein R69776_03477 [Paraburkholderia nemoris]
MLAAIRCPGARELHTTIRFVSGIEAANWAEPDGNQVNAIAGVDTSICVHLRQRFQVDAPSLASLHRGGLKVPPNGTAFAVQSMRRVSHESRKGIAKTPQNQRSPDRQKLPIARERATERALTTFDRIFSLCRLKLTRRSKWRQAQAHWAPIAQPIPSNESLGDPQSLEGGMVSFGLF